MARKILLADDSVTAQNMGRKILTDAGYEVITVNNGSAALKRVGEQRPDLIVLDVYMPGYSGLEVCQRLKDSPDTSRIPILLTVGKLEPFKPEEARRVQADAFIVKPFEASELLSALTRLEDRIVPQSEGGRFANSASSVERFGSDSFSRKSESSVSDETESGWKNRIRFPEKKKKAEEAEPEPEDFGTTSPRDYRKPIAQPPAAGRSAPEAASVVPDIPRDITPDELDALSALAAKLDGPIAEPQNARSDAEKLPPAEALAAEIEAKAEAEPAASAVAADTSAAPAAEPVVPAIPTEIETKTETVVVQETVRVQPDLTPAPIDRDDEPRFASAPLTEAASEVASAETKQQDTPQTPVFEVSPAPVADQPTEQPAIEAAQAQPVIEASSENAPQSVSQEATSASVSETVSEHVPTEAELAEALRLLTPSTPEPEAPGAQKSEEEVTVPADVVQALEEVGRNNGLVGRWVAESVALSAEESSASLEAEMFQKFSASADTPARAVPAATPVEVPAAQISETQTVETVAEPVVTPEPAAIAAAHEPENKAEEAAAEEEQEPATTFASGMQQAESRGEESHSAALAETSVAPEAVYQPSTEEQTGGQDEMAKDKADKTKAAWSNWHQIRAGATPAVGTDPVQAAKEAAAEETPKAMAAAAAGDGSSSTEESNDIANIVDSVLADLRPKIVEEISKKMRKSKKS